MHRFDPRSIRGRERLGDQPLALQEREHPLRPFCSSGSVFIHSPSIQNSLSWSWLAGELLTLSSVNFSISSCRAKISCEAS